MASIFILLLAGALGQVAAQVCAGQQNFPNAEDVDEVGFIRTLMPGSPANGTLCPQHWIWFRLHTRFARTYSRLRRRGTSWLPVAVTEIVPHSLSVKLDAGYDDESYRFTTLSLIVVNGTPPSDALRADPYDAVAYSTVFHYYEEYTDRETLTLGFNDTLGGSCHTALADEVYFGVRCVHPLGQKPGPCVYNLTVTALPHTLRDGDAFDAYLRPFDPDADEIARHYYRVALSSYESLVVSIEREGDGRLLRAPDGMPLGVGLAGGVYAQRLTPLNCPSNNSELITQACEVGLNDTSSCMLGHACSSPTDPTDDLVIMIEATVGNRPVTFIDQQNSPYEMGCLPTTLCEYVPNLVDKNGYRPLHSAIPGAEDRPPRYNVPDMYIRVSPEWALQTNNRNELRHDRGTYRLSVSQLQYAEGALIQGEQIPGCVSYGQWRYYRIDTSGAKDASISVHVTTTMGQGVGGVYIRQMWRPNANQYTALAERSVPAGTAQRATASTCAPRAPTTWQLAVMLEDEATAVSRGIRPTQFVLSVYLAPAMLQADGGVVTPRGADATSGSAAKGRDGDGFICCGGFKYFLVPSVPAHLSLQATLKVTRGVARALYLKAASCPKFPDDVNDDVCEGKCVVSWLTRFDPYDGSPTSRDDTLALVPNGLGRGCPAACPADLRQKGEWLVGVQAMPNTDAEFELSLSLVEPPPRNDGHQCDPSEPECRGLIDKDGAAATLPSGFASGRLQLESAIKKRRWPDGKPLGRGHSAPYLRPEFAAAIAEGRKTVEGRPGGGWVDGKRGRMVAVDDYVRFKVVGEAEGLCARVTSVAEYPTFAAMISSVGVKALLPDTCPTPTAPMSQAPSPRTKRSQTSAARTARSRPHTAP